MFGRGSMFPSMFGNDPFAHMDHMMRSMMADPFMGMGNFGHPGMLHQAAPPGSHLPAPVIEEVDDEQGQRSAPGNEPIVEEPDEEPHAHARAQRQPHLPHVDPFNQLQFPGFGGFFGNMGGHSGGAAVMSFSSSSFTSTGGPNGVTYSSTTTSRMGPGGVRETQQMVRDGRTGTESVTISRGLNDKARTVKRMRDASGREVTEQHLEGLEEQEASQFDERWRREAERKLPTWGSNQPRLADGLRRPQQQPTLALPDSAGAGAGLRRGGSSRGQNNGSDGWGGHGRYV